MTLTDAMILECSLARWGGDPKRCRWCDAEFKGRRFRWCSDACADTANREHHFNAGSHYAKRMRPACERCGAKPGTVRLADGTWSRRIDLEAHHVEHALGRHRECSCIHHSSNLEVVCHECHVAGHVAERKAELAAAAALAESEYVARYGPRPEQLRLPVYDRRDLAQPRG